MTTTPLKIEEEKTKHWSEILAEKLVNEGKEPYIISGAATLSGPIHLGTICEPVYSAAIASRVNELGKKIEFVYGGDTLDAFDGIPALLSKYEKFLSPHLGKPLCEVPDPFDCCSSYAEHYLNEMKFILSELNIRPNFVMIDLLYKEGKFDEYALKFIENLDEVKILLEETSMRELPKDWSPIMPICEKCGKIATTSVKNLNEEKYEYICNKNVDYTKGCGYSGENEIKDHRYKLTWRLHWPAWMEVIHTSIEGAGVDHHTKGGSWDSLLAIYERIFRKKPPIGFKYGWFFFKGKKFSKSAGRGAMAKEIISLLPAPVIKYFMLRPDIQENRDFDPTPYKLLEIYEDYEYAASISNRTERELSRADRKKVIAYLIAGKKIWESKFIDVLLYYQIYKDWKKVAEELRDERGVSFLSKYIENLILGQLIPDEYSFSISLKRSEDANVMKTIEKFLEKINPKMEAVEIHNLVFETANELNIKPAELFKNLYRVILSKERGPRIGKLIKAIGVDTVKEALLKEEKQEKH